MHITCRRVPPLPLTAVALALALALVCSTQAAPVPQAYVKASNTGERDLFGVSIAVSCDTMVVGALNESSNASGVNGNQNDNSAVVAGAAYVFVRNGTRWAQQAYLKASNPGPSDRFGYSVAISGDTIVIGAPFEDSSATDINGVQDDESAQDAGAAYVFVRRGTNWTQQAYLKPSSIPVDNYYFGWSLSVSGDTVIIGAPFGDTSTMRLNADVNRSTNGGAAYVFVRAGTNWTEQACLQGFNTIDSDNFGWSVSVSGDTAVIGPYQFSNATGAYGCDAIAQASGAAYVFVRQGHTWSEQAYLKASNGMGPAPGQCYGERFGISVAISGNTVVVGAPLESSAATRVNGDQTSQGALWSGAAYVFVRQEATWSQQAYLKASNTESEDHFGYAVAVSGDTVAVAATQEDSVAVSVNGNSTDNSATGSGAVYVFGRHGTNWIQQAYLKAFNTDAFDYFGQSVSVSGDTVVVGAYREGSRALGVNGNQSDNSIFEAGAAYVFAGAGPPPDEDGDGVPDVCDACPHTPAGSITEASGCSIPQLVPCDGPWRNHGQYLLALKDVTARFVQAGLITDIQRRALLQEGARSDCGKR
jgi:hypothetical protein